MSPHAGEMLIQEVAPRIRSLTKTLQKVGVDDREEIYQDALAFAASLIASLEARGKQLVTPGNVAFFAVRLVVKAGRRSTGSSKTDVLHPGTQLSGRSRVHSLEEPVYDEGTQEPLTLGEVLASEAEDPSVTGARNLDWHALLSTLDEKARHILKCLAEGRPLLEVALAYGISRSGVQTIKEKLKHVVTEFMGEDLLADVQRLPAWKDNIRASREKVACRIERQMA